ncbi:MAG: hypothetical protein N2A99_03190 [Carnobacterium alterfunditum]
MIKKVTIVLLVMLSLSILALFGLHPAALLSHSFLWLTVLIVPWIILYWLIRLTKTLEKNSPCGSNSENYLQTKFAQ